MAKRKYYAYLVDGKKGVTDNWPECQRIVAGKNGAKFKGFESRAAAAAWLDAGADYKLKNVAVEDGIYFDSGTGAGEGVEINVTDKMGKKLLHKVLEKDRLNEKFYFNEPSVEQGELQIIRDKIKKEIEFKKKQRKH